MLTTKEISRRQFLKASLLGAAGIVLTPALLKAAAGKSNTTAGPLKVAFIGLGQQAIYLQSGFIHLPDVEIVAGCDPYDVKRQRFQKRVSQFYQNAGKSVKVDLYEDYLDVLKRPDIDVVVIAVPDHNHAVIAVAACKAGKDIYCEKPMTFTIKEGRALVNAVRKNKIVFGLGSQQRSDNNFQHAVRMCQEGRIGKIKKIYAQVGEPPIPYNQPKQECPAGLDWEKWLGPLDKRVHYNPELNPVISIEPEVNEQGWGGWRWYKETGGGYTTDWGAHMFDIAQWGIGMDGKGPVEIIPAGYKGTPYMTFIYDNGTVMTQQPYDQQMTKGVKFFGENGWIAVTRGGYDASDKSLYPGQAGNQGANYETQEGHYANFVSAVRRRKDPVVPVEVGHSSCTCCTLGNIADDLKVPLKWDYKMEKFVGNHAKEANKHRLMSYKYHKGYSI